MELIHIKIIDGEKIEYYHYYDKATLSETISKKIGDDLIPILNYYAILPCCVYNNNIWICCKEDNNNIIHSYYDLKNEKYIEVNDLYELHCYLKNNNLFNAKDYFFRYDSNVILLDKNFNIIDGRYVSCIDTIIPNLMELSISHEHKLLSYFDINLREIVVPKIEDFLPYAKVVKNTYKIFDYYDITYIFENDKLLAECDTIYNVAEYILYTIDKKLFIINTDTKETYDISIIIDYVYNSKIYNNFISIKNNNYFSSNPINIKPTKHNIISKTDYKVIYNIIENFNIKETFNGIELKSEYNTYDIEGNKIVDFSNYNSIEKLLKDLDEYLNLMKNISLIK